MRRLLTAAALLVALPSLALAETLTLKPGASAPFTLAENPSTGFNWRIDEGASAGLGLLEISDGGHTPGAAMPGAPGTHQWTIRALKPGKATIVFAYQRPWEPAPAETRRLPVIISR
ncbi:MAG: chagasin [Methylocystis sp.]|nr:MAG: chagasin [Methylocystis sp.]